MAHTPSEDPESDIQVASDALPLIETDRRYLPEQMLCCGKCGRNNPPNRAACFYCGAKLEISGPDAKSAKLNLARPEAWEDGFSLVYSGKKTPHPEAVAAASDRLGLPQESIEEILSAGIALPLIYLRSLPDANALAASLSERGFDCAIVGDDLLMPKIAPTRLRGVKFTAEAVVLEDFNTSRVTLIGNAEPVLIVTGSIIRSSIEESGMVSRRAIKITDETSAVTDERVIDIYPLSDVYGFRIRPSGFDFSCLGERMGPLAAENMAEVIQQIRASFSAARFVESYTSVSRLLDDIWPIQEVIESSSVSRGPLGGARRQRRTVADNTLQFTKFSRLQRHFI